MAKKAKPEPSAGEHGRKVRRLPAVDSLHTPAVALPLLVIAGALAAAINTIAGGGSLLILPLLVAVGLPAGVANGTNRIAIAVQSLASVATFHRRGVRDYDVFARLVVPICLGAVLGAWLATRLSDEILRPLFGWILVAWALVLIIRPGRFLDTPSEPHRPGVAAITVSVGIGIYGGFLQAGVGFPLMALLISGLGYEPIRANAVKVLLVLVYTLLVIPLFVLEAQIAWREGCALAVGSVVGGWIGTRLQIRAGARLIHWVVVVMVVVSGLAMAL